MNAALPDLPERFGKTNSVWRSFDRWCKAGVRKRLAAARREPGLAELQLDATTVKAPPTAATGRRRPGGETRTPTPGGVWAAAAAD